MGRTHERIKITDYMFDTSPSKRHCTEALRKNSGKKLEVSSQQSACQNSRNYFTGIRHQLDSVAHLVLSIEEHKATELKISMKSMLSHVTKLLTPHPVNAAPAIMKNCVRSFIVSQINTLTRVAHDIACSEIGLRSVPHQFLQICDIVWGNCSRSSAAYPKFKRSDTPRSG